MNLARVAKLDLVEVAPQAKPPVCRIMDFRKVIYEEKKQDRLARKKQKKVVIKEIKFKLKIEDNDYNIKINRIKKFLDSLYRVKVSIFFKGRELAHPELGERLKKRIVEDLTEFGDFEQIGRLMGRNITLVVVPKK